MHIKNVMNIIKLPCRIIEVLDNRGPDNTVTQLNHTTQKHAQLGSFYYDVTSCPVTFETILFFTLGKFYARKIVSVE